MSEAELILGWQVTPNLDPRYWFSPDAMCGKQADADLFKVPAGEMAAHTAIIAQSGSGKSFFLGRIVEEIALRTRARCLILDPNADFRRLHEVEGAELWSTGRYTSASRSGKLCHEPSRAEFANAWSEIKVEVLSATRSREGVATKPLRFSWPSVSAEFLAEDLGPAQRSELENLHAFVKIIYDALSLGSTDHRKTDDYLRKAEMLLNLAIANPADFETAVKDLSRAEFHDASSLQSSVLLRLGLFRTSSLMTRRRSIDHLVKGALAAARYVSDDTRRFYFGKLSSILAAGIIQTGISDEEGASATEADARISVIDLPSIAHLSTRLLAVNACIKSQWDAARAAWDEALQHLPVDDARVPTFIVVDEAHNVIPREQRNRAEYALREQFRTIVAEGRKYGLFLILVSQRPDKLDPLIVSECENRAIMKLSSRSALDVTREMLALEDIPPNVLAKCLELPVGRVLMVGSWAKDGPQFLYSAARRTVEGGRNLRREKWAVAPARPSPATQQQLAAAPQEVERKAAESGAISAKKPPSKRQAQKKRPISARTPKRTLSKSS